MSAGASGLADDHVGGTQMDGLWWVRALALHEKGGPQSWDKTRHIFPTGEAVLR